MTSRQNRLGLTGHDVSTGLYHCLAQTWEYICMYLQRTCPSTDETLVMIFWAWLLLGEARKVVSKFFTKGNTFQSSGPAFSQCYFFLFCFFSSASILSFTSSAVRAPSFLAFAFLTFSLRAATSILVSVKAAKFYKKICKFQIISNNLKLRKQITDEMVWYIEFS